VATVSTKLVTVDEFWEFVHRGANRDRTFELIRGEIVEMSRPGKLHGVVCAAIVVLLSLFAAQRKKGYVCANDTGVVVERDPDSVRGPDILFFEDDVSFDKIDPKWGDIPPRLAVEVMSPNDTASDMNERVADQLRCGTPLVWLVHIETRKVTVFQQQKAIYVLDEADEITGEDVLPDLCLRVADFFKLPGR
jgi:Uma2 family endonuclease